MSGHLDQPTGDSALGVVGLAGIVLAGLVILVMRAPGPDDIAPLPVAASSTTETAAVVTTTTTVPSTTTSTTMATTTTTEPPVPVTTALARPPRPADGRFRSTSYCLTGTMASGRRTYVGAVAGNRWPIGTVLTAWPNPWGDPRMEFTVEDRHGKANAAGFPTQIDFAMPGECTRALEWGNRRFVEVTVIGEEL